jgi:hypothetical protein
MNLFKNSVKADRPLESSMTEAVAKLASVDPECIHIEHVCIAFGVSRKRARRICEEAVERGIFHRQIQVLCPDGSVAASASAYDGLPATIRCRRDSAGAFDSITMHTHDLPKREIFALCDSYMPFRRRVASIEGNRWTRWPMPDRHTRR